MARKQHNQVANATTNDAQPQAPAEPVQDASESEKPAKQQPEATTEQEPAGTETAAAESTETAAADGKPSSDPKDRVYVYRVERRLLRNHKEYEIGDAIGLTMNEAAELLSSSPGVLSNYFGKA